MPQLKCPACGARGEVRETEEHFEVRGQWPDGHWPVRKCRQCGVGLIVKMRIAPPGVKAKRIDDATWAAMEASWNRAFGETPGSPKPPQAQTFAQWAANPDLSGSSTIQEQFDRFLENSDTEDGEAIKNDDDVPGTDDDSNPDDYDFEDHKMSNLDICKAFLDEDEWSYHQLEDSSILRMSFNGNNGRWKVFMSADEDGIVAVDSMLEQNVPKDRRIEISELLTRVNYGKRIGGFQLDLSDGELRFHSGIDVEGAELTTSILEHLLYTNVVTMDRYFKVIMAVSYAGVDAESAYEGLD